MCALTCLRTGDAATRVRIVQTTRVARTAISLLLLLIILASTACAIRRAHQGRLALPTEGTIAIPVAGGARHIMITFSNAYQSAVAVETWTDAGSMQQSRVLTRNEGESDIEVSIGSDGGVLGLRFDGYYVGNFGGGAAPQVLLDGAWTEMLPLWQELSRTNRRFLIRVLD